MLHSFMVRKAITVINHPRKSHCLQLQIIAVIFKRRVEESRSQGGQRNR